MIALSFSFPHHGKYSSYHRLLHYLAADDKVFDASMPQFMYRKVFNPRGYTQSAWRAWMERRAWNHANKSKSDWLHYLYPEHGYFRGVDFRSGKTQICMSCHLPEETFEAGGERRKMLRVGLKHSKAVIVMSPDNVDYYQSLAPDANVAFIPHGIDIHHFKPSPKEHGSFDERPRILTVGNMLRDFETLAKTINLAADRRTDWEFHVLALPDRLEKLHDMLSDSGKKLFKPRQGLSDEKLKQLYLDCDLLYLPLLAATANNAVIEAMASGLPMILTDFPATRAYAGDCAVYVACGMAENAYHEIEKLLNNPADLKKMAENGRTEAEEQLAWEVIAKKQYHFFHNHD